MVCCYAKYWSVSHIHTYIMTQTHVLSLYVFHLVSPPIVSLWQCEYFGGLQCVAFAHMSLFVKFVAHTGAQKLSLLVMPALLWFSAERIRGLRERLICQGARTRTHTHIINTKRQICLHTHKAYVSMHVSTDSNTPFDTRNTH